MSHPLRQPDAREVDRVEALITVNDSARVDNFLDRCSLGSTWRVKIRTAQVTAHVLARTPLGTFDERVCTCLRLGLDLPVPVEPGLRFHIEASDDPTLSATGVVRPWDTPAGHFADAP
jgi:hypothetical protein